ncbi:MAG: sensor histidine kinase [Phormidesmis sp.]
MPHLLAFSYSHCIVNPVEPIRVSIKDTGPGIPEQIQTKVFDPFFTTKPVGEGTGLGLSLAYQTINKHQGKISLSSDGRSGTEFIIDLPIERCATAASID